jgi:hypothetical protein
MLHTYHTKIMHLIIFKWIFKLHIFLVLTIYLFENLLFLKNFNMWRITIPFNIDKQNLHTQIPHNICHYKFIAGLQSKKNLENIYLVLHACTKTKLNSKY